MNNLFNLTNLKNKLQEFTVEASKIKESQEVFLRWQNQVDLTREAENQQSFLQEFFGQILGYQAISGKKDNSLWWESGSVVDGTKPDGILGFNLKSYKTQSSDSKSDLETTLKKLGDIRCVIELKDSKVDLDKKQNRKNFSGSPVEQAFSYVSKVGGNCEFVIVSNFLETRLYQSSDQSRYHVFLLKELAESEEKIREFHFLLAKNRLFLSTKNSSPTHLLNKVPSGEEIEKRFYEHYKTLRENIWQDLIALNKSKHYGRNFYLYKAQKLIDRIIFIRFCRENGALNNDAVLDALNQRFIPKKYDRLKFLFAAMNDGNPEIGIAKFNGGLFAPDSDLDGLEISDQIIDKIKILYDYDFGSDLDVNILGHIFEQSISDLENLTGDQEKKRKKDGIFYTPAFITEFIVREAVGTWLCDQKNKIGLEEIETESSQQNLKKIPENSKKLKETKSKTSAKIIQEKWCEYAKALASIKVLDPACGSGAFLVKVFDFLQKEWDEVRKFVSEQDFPYSYKDILAQNIFGVDLNPASVGITRLSLWLKTACHLEPLCALDDNIKIGNSLIDDDKIAGYYHEYEGRIVHEAVELQGGLFAAENFAKDSQEIDAKFKKSLAFAWEGNFPKIITSKVLDSKTGGWKYEGGFDVVVGNPPYVGISDIEIDNRRYFETIYKTAISRFDLYSLFIERGFNLGKKFSNLCFIIPIKYLSNIHFTKSRELLIKNGLVKIANIAEKVFDEAQVESVILFFKKDQNLAFHYQNCQFGEKEVREISSRILPESNHVFPNGSDNLEILTKIEENCVKLQEIAEVRDGIRSGQVKDVFFLKKPIDADSKLLVFGKDILRYCADEPKNWVNYKEKEMKGEELKRLGASVSSGLAMRSKEIFERPKILTRKIGEEITAYFDTQKLYYDQTLHSTHITSPNYNPLFILAIFNSKLFKFYYKSKNSAGGKIFPQIRIAFLNQLPIKIINPQDQQPLAAKAQKMLDLNSQVSKISEDFFTLLKVDLGVQKITRALEKWHSLNVEEFFAEIAKQNHQLALDKKSQWIELFEEKKQAAQRLKLEISSLDTAIDKEVFEIYGLNDDEISAI